MDPRQAAPGETGGGADPGEGTQPPVSRRPRLLDLFSCAGAGARGYIAAGFDVVGIDITQQPRYPGEHIVADVLSLDPDWIAEHFDAVHASPMCQRFTGLRHRYPGGGNPYPNQIPATRRLLQAAGLPYVIENVQPARAELIDPTMLCGSMFDGLRVSRHRLFETTFPLDAPRPCPGRHPLHFTHDKRKAHYGRLDEWTAFVQVTGGGNCSVAAAADAMGLAGAGLTKAELNEGLPPAYTRHIGTALLTHLLTRKEAAA